VCTDRFASCVNILIVKVSAVISVQSFSLPQRLIIFFSVPDP
jgi:hypothetical protein